MAQSAKIVVNIFPTYQLPIYGAAVAMGPVFAYLSSDFFDFKERILTPLESFLTLNRLFDEKDLLSAQEFTKIYTTLKEDPAEAVGLIVDDLSELWHNAFLTAFVQSNFLSLANTALDHFFLASMGCYGSRLSVSMVLTQHTHAGNFAMLFNQGAKIVELLVAKSASDFVIAMLAERLDSAQEQLVFRKSTELLLKDISAIKLMASEHGREISENLTADLHQLLTEGVGNLSALVRELSNAGIAFKALSSKAPEALGYYAAILLIKQNVLELIADKSKSIAQADANATHEIHALQHHVAENIEAISLRDGTVFVAQDYSEALAQKRSLEMQAQFWKHVKSTSEQLAGHLSSLVHLGYFGYKHIFEKLPIGGVPLTVSSILKAQAFLSGGLDFEINSKNLLLAKDRLEEFFELLGSPNQSQVIRTSNVENKIIFDDYILARDDIPLVTIDHLELRLGKHYAFTGQSGCGKTSTLMDLKVGVFGALSSSGTISMPTVEGHAAKVMFVDQQLYLPSQSTLLEATYFPNRFMPEQKQDLENQVLYLFKALQMDERMNDEAFLAKLNSHEFNLSAGQSKKLAITQAILNQPDILILDETFSNLDAKSIELAQQAIQEYLPNASLLIVDHHAADNNYKGFYDYEVHFSQGRVFVHPMATKPVDFHADRSSFDQEIVAEYVADCWGDLADVC